MTFEELLHNDESNNFGMTFNYSSVFNDGEWTVGGNVKASNGFSTSFSEKGKDVEKIRKSVSGRLQKDIDAFQKKNKKSFEEELLDEIRALKLDNKILKERLDKINAKKDSICTLPKTDVKKQEDNIENKKNSLEEQKRKPNASDTIVNSLKTIFGKDNIDEELIKKYLKYYNIHNY